MNCITKYQKSTSHIFDSHTFLKKLIKPIPLFCVETVQISNCTPKAIHNNCDAFNNFFFQILNRLQQQMFLQIFLFEYRVFNLMHNSKNKTKKHLTMKTDFI